MDRRKNHQRSLEGTGPRTHTGPDMVSGPHTGPGTLPTPIANLETHMLQWEPNRRSLLSSGERFAMLLSSKSPGPDVEGLELPKVFSCIPRHRSRIFLGIQSCPTASKERSQNQLSERCWHGKTQEERTYNEDKNQCFEMYQEWPWILDLAAKYIKVIMIEFQRFRKPSGDVDDIMEKIEVLQ